MRGRFYLACALTLFGAAAWAQTPAAASAPTTTFRARTQMVYLPVVVRDKHGDPVRGLKAEQFHVEQDGRRQKLSVFEEVTNESQANDAKKLGHMIDASGFLYNLGSAERSPQRLIIVLIDNVNSDYVDQRRAKDAILRFLSKDLPRDQPVALLMLDHMGVMQLHPFTTDSAVLADSLRKVTGSLHINAPGKNSQEGESLIGDSATLRDAASKTDAVLIDQMMKWEQGANLRYQLYQTKSRAFLTMQSLQQLAGAYQGVPGRKALIWMTNGLPLMLNDVDLGNLANRSDELMDLYRSTWRMLAQSNIAVYPVSVEGLTTGISDRSATMSARAAWDYTGLQAPPYNEPAERIATMESFAQATGGHARYLTNDLEGAMAEAAHESGAYYMVGYYLQPETKAGWRKLKVTVDEPKVTVRAREGFHYDQRPTEREQKLLLQSAVESAVDYTAIRFAAKAQSAVASAKPGLVKLPIRLLLPLDSIKIDHDNNDRVDVSFVIFASKAGKAVANISGAFRQALDKAFQDQASHDGIQFEPALELPPGEYSIKIIVRDNLQEQIGALQFTATASPE